MQKDVLLHTYEGYCGKHLHKDSEHEGLDLCVVSIDDDVGLLRNMVSREEEAAVMWIKD